MWRRRISLTQGVSILALLALATTLLFASTAFAQDNPRRAKVRLAVAGFQWADAAPLTAGERELADLIAAQLSVQTEFEIIERAELHRVLGETALSLVQNLKPADAIRVGKLLRADWLLLGGLVANDGTNFVVARIVDANTGVIRDLTSVPLLVTNLLATADPIVSFILSSRNAVHALDQRLFIALGAFEDLSVYRRFPDFANHLRTSHTKSYAGTRVAVVERSMVNPLLTELRLGLGGMTEVQARGSVAQPAFLLVDGLYQSFQDTNSKVNIILRMQKLGGQVQTASFNEPPGKELDAKIAGVIEKVLGELDKTPVSVSRQKEAEAQVARGRELARFGQDGSVLFTLAPVERNRAERSEKLSAAIEAFRAALFLEPSSTSAKHLLGLCLLDPHIGQKEEARSLLREVIAAAPDSDTVKSVREKLAASYKGEDDRVAAELYSALHKEATDLADTAKYMRSIAAIYHNLFTNNLVSRAERLRIQDEHWRTDCRLAQAQGEQGKRIHTYGVFRSAPDLYYPVFKNRPAMHAHLEELVPKLIAEFPALAPFFIAAYRTRFHSNAPPWIVEKYDALLDLSEQNPQGIFAPVSFYGDLFFDNLLSFTSRSNYAVGERIARILAGPGRQYLKQQEQDRVDMMLGCFHRQRAEWQDALVAFERLGTREVHTGFPGLWGKESVFSAAPAVADCKRRLAGQAPLLVDEFQIGKPVVTMPQPRLPFYSNYWDYTAALSAYSINFLCHGPQVWISYGPSVYLHNTAAAGVDSIALDVTNNSSITAIAVTGHTLWLGTATNGLIAMNTSTRKSRLFTPKDGLAMPGISALYPERDKLWIGFASPDSGLGGLGFFDFSSETFVAMSAELNTNLTEFPQSGRFSGRATVSNSVPRLRITGFARSSPEYLWVSTFAGVLRYWPANAKWERSYMGGAIYSLASNDRFVLAGNYEPGGWSDKTTLFGGLAVCDVTGQEWKTLTRADGLPNNNIKSVALDGTKAWIGGKGYLALMDLTIPRVQRLARLGDKRIIGLQIQDNNVWFAADRSLYRVPR